MNPDNTVNVPRRVQKQINQLPVTVQDRMTKALLSLGSEPRPVASRNLKGREGYRLRVGDYRAIYRVDDDNQEVTVLRVGHRRDVYR